MVHTFKGWPFLPVHQGTTRHTHEALPECDFHVRAILGYLHVMLRSLVLALLAASTLSAEAQSNGLPVEGALLPGWREADGRHMAGLSLRLEPGWKTYWRAPHSESSGPERSTLHWIRSRRGVSARCHGARSLGTNRAPCRGRGWHLPRRLHPRHVPRPGGLAVQWGF